MKKISLLLLTALYVPFIFLDYSKTTQALSFIEEMVTKHGFEESYLIEIFQSAEKKEKIINSMNRPAEKKFSWTQYKARLISPIRVNNGADFLQRFLPEFEKAEEKFGVPKEIIAAIIGIESSYGSITGRERVIDSLSTLAFDYPRRSNFFTKELLILLTLIDNKIISKDILYGSWAGAFGNFQFMPSTIKNYALDYNKNANIELKEIEDSFASAANYINKIGWKKNQPCFYKVELEENIPLKYLNTSAKKIKNKKKLKFFKKYLKNNQNMLLNENVITAIVTPDKDIIPGSNTLKPAYLVFSNYEKVLKWNRSLRFAIAVCTLKNKFKNEI